MNCRKVAHKNRPPPENPRKLHKHVRLIQEKLWDMEEEPLPMQLLAGEDVLLGVKDLEDEEHREAEPQYFS